MAIAEQLRSPRASRALLLLLLGVLSAIFIGVVPWGLALLLPTAVASFLLIFLVISVRPAVASHHSLMAWTLTSFILHLAIGALITFTDLVNYFGPDAISYHADATALAEQWSGGSASVAITGGKEGFYYLLAGLYTVVGPHEIAGLVVNAACGAALIPVWFLATSQLFGSSSARWVPGLLTLTPAFLVWPSQLLREGPILLLISIAGAAAIGLTGRVRPLPVAALVVALLMLFTFRSSIALLLGAGFLVGTALGLRKLWVGVSLQVVVFGMMVVLIFGAGLGYSGFRLATQVDLGDVEAFRSSTAEEAGSAIRASDVSSVGGAVATLPVGALRVLLGPLPWEIGLRQAPALVDGFFIWALVVPFVVGLREAWHRLGRRLLALLFPAVLLVALLAVVIGNYGLLLRERPQVMVLLVPILALGFESISRRRRATASTT